MVFFSLVVSTLYRTETWPRFLNSLCQQSFSDFEVIVVDQNDDDRLLPVLQPYQDRLTLMHCRSAKGLSRGRNVGMQRASGAVLGFPDDDCWYAPDTLRRVHDTFANDGALDGLSICPRTENNDLYNKAFPEFPDILNKNNALRMICSISLFMRRSVVDAVGAWDECLGVGPDTLVKGGEDLDYPLRSLKLSHKWRYEPSITVYHPAYGNGNSRDARKKDCEYGRGFGFILYRHFPIGKFFYYCLRSIGGIFIYAMRRDWRESEKSFYVLKGRLSGWWAGYRYQTHNAAPVK